MAHELGVGYEPLEDFDPRAYDLLVNATPVGAEAEEETPFDVDATDPECVVVDLAYRRTEPTRLVREMRARGGVAIDGREALLFQALPQFEWMTGVSMPLDLGRRALGLGAATGTGGDEG